MKKRHRKRKFKKKEMITYVIHPQIAMQLISSFTEPIRFGSLPGVTLARLSNPYKPNKHEL